MLILRLLGDTDSLCFHWLPTKQTNMQMAVSLLFGSLYETPVDSNFLPQDVRAVQGFSSGRRFLVRLVLYKSVAL